MWGSLPGMRLFWYWRCRGRRRAPMRSEVGKHPVAAFTIGARGDVDSATLLGREGESERGVNSMYVSSQLARAALIVPFKDSLEPRRRRATARFQSMCFSFLRRWVNNCVAWKRAQLQVPHATMAEVFLLTSKILLRRRQLPQNSSSPAGGRQHSISRLSARSII
jgi:hypothetical protein